MTGWRRAVGIILAGAPNLAAAAAVVAYLIAEGLWAPATLAAIIGPLAALWVGATLLALVVAGVLAMLPRRTGVMEIEAAARILAGFLLAAYAVGLVVSGAPMTGGLAVALGLKQIARAWEIVFEKIPALQTAHALVNRDMGDG